MLETKQVETTILQSNINVPLNELAVYSESAYNSETDSLTFQINRSPADKCWRLIHDGTKLIDMIETKGILNTINNLICCETKEECDQQIETLGLDTTEFDERQNKLIDGRNELISE